MSKHLWKIAAVIVLLLICVSFVTARSGKRSAGWLGVETQTVDDNLAEAFDLDSEYGAIINQVIPDSPADEAGLREDDIIIAFESQKVWESADLTEFVLEGKRGDDVEIKIIRDGEEMVLNATLGKRSSRRLSYSYSSRSPRIDVLLDDDYDHYYDRDDYHHGYIGVTLSGLTRQLGEHFGVKRGRGALITEVEKQSPAAEAGLKAGDVIVSIDGFSVHDPSDVSEGVVDKNEGEEVKIELLRNHETMTVTVEVEESDDDYHYRTYNFGGVDNHRIVIPSLPSLPSLPSFPSLPSLNGVYYDDLDDFRHDRYDFDEDMRELQKDLQELKSIEMKDLRKDMKEVEKELRRIWKKIE